MTFNESQRAYNEIRTDVNMSQKSHKIKGKVKFNNVEKNKDLDEVEESEEKNEDLDEVEESENESEKIQKRVVVENALRNKLFKFGNKQKRNKSAEPRNKK